MFIVHMHVPHFSADSTGSAVPRCGKQEIYIRTCVAFLASGIGMKVKPYDIITKA